MPKQTGNGRAIRHSIVLADDQSMLLDLLTSILQEEFDVVATASNGEAFVKEVRRLKPDIAVTDLTMPVLNGMDALRELDCRSLETKFVVYTASSDATMACQAMELGAQGYVLKQAASAELVLALRTVLEGRTFVSPRISEEMPGETAFIGRKKPSGDSRRRSR